MSLPQFDQEHDERIYGVVGALVTGLGVLTVVTLLWSVLV